MRISTLRYKSKSVQLPLVFRPGGQEVDAGGLEAGMAQHIRQLHDVTAGPVKGRGEQMAKVVGKDLAGRDPRRLAQPLHLRPDLTAAEGRPVSGEKDLAGSGFLLFGVFQQLAAQLAGDEDGADLAFQGDLRPARSGRLHGNILHLADPDAGGADGLHQQSQPRFVLRLCRSGEGVVVGPGQVPAVIPEHPPLDLEKLHPAVPEAQKVQQTVQGGEHGIDAGGGVAPLHQMGLPRRRPFLGDLPPLQPAGEGPDVPQIFLYGGGAFFFQPKMVRIRLDVFQCWSVFAHGTPP